MPMKTTLMGLQSRPDHAAPRRGVTSSTVLVPVLNLNVAADMVQLAGTLAEAESGMRNVEPGIDSAFSVPRSALPRVVVVGVVEVPHDQPLTTGLVMAR